MTRHVFAIDPGDKNNGFCYFKYDPETKTADTKIMQVMDQKGVHDMLKIAWGVSQADESPELFFVVENFRVDSKSRGAIFQWSEMETIRVIGAIELAAKWCNAKFVLQEPGEVWPLARKWAIPYPFHRINKHPEDEKSAWCHGAKFMMRMRWIDTVDQVTMFGQERM
jgi:hypothetical protein